MTMTNLALLLLALVFANSPWFSARLFFLIPVKQQPKNVAWCLFELVVLYFVLGVIARYAEHATIGQIAPQNGSSTPLLLVCFWCWPSLDLCTVFFGTNKLTSIILRSFSRHAECIPSFSV